MSSDDSRAAGTETASVPGSHAGMDFINDVSVAGSQASIDAGFDTLCANLFCNDSVETTSK
jgi:hypothetical protein